MDARHRCIAYSFAGFDNQVLFRSWRIFFPPGKYLILIVFDLDEKPRISDKSLRLFWMGIADAV